MSPLILAGDIGGTKTLLATWANDGPPDAPWRIVREHRYRSRDYTRLEDVVSDYRERGPGEAIAAAGFGISGPVLDGRVVTTNLPWEMTSRDSLSAACDGIPVSVMNDLAAMANGVPSLADRDVRTVHPGVERGGNVGVIAAGTGLGQAFLHFDGARHRASGTEGGHTNFGPRNERELALCRYLLPQFGGHLSYERVLSGMGLGNLYRFVTDVERGEPNPAVDAAIRAGLDEGRDVGGVVGEAAIERRCPVCIDVVNWFVSLLGAQAANLAVTVMALGGVYVGGGVVQRLGDAFDDALFLDAFFAKGRYESMMREIPVRLILSERVSLIGGREAARELLG